MSGFRINTNTAALSAMRQGNLSATAINRSIERLSSGQSINRAADDSAGLAITERMRSQVEGLQQGSRNVQDGIGLLQTAEGGLSGILDSLHRMRSLAVQAANDTLSDEDRALVQLEVDQQLEEIDRQVDSTTFNQLSLIDGTFATEKNETYVIGADLTNQTPEAGSVASSPDYSPSGNEILYANNIGPSRLEQRPIAGGAPTTIPLPPPSESQGRYSPNGTRITYTTNFPGDIHVANIDGSGDINITNTPAVNENFPSWYSDGTRVAYEKNGGMAQAFARNADGTGVEDQITLGDVIGYVDFDSPLTQVFFGANNGVNSGSVVSEPLGGGAQTVLTTGAAGGFIDISPQLSPDGSLLLFIRFPSADLFIRNSDGSGPEVSLTAGTGLVTSVSQHGAWSPDMRRFAFGSGGDVYSANTRLFLDVGSDIADPASVTVRKNGVTLTQGTDYSVTGTREIRFTTTGIPDIGDTVDVSYLTGAEEGIIIHDGADKDQIIALSLPEARVQDLFPSGTPDVSTRDSASNAIALIDSAITRVTGGLAEIGAQSNRLEVSFARNQVQVENTSASRSRIRDLDFADEIVGFTKQQIIQQAGMSALSQANVSTQGVLQLLQ